MKEKHYNQHPSGIECIDVVKHFDFCIGNVIKYVWRCGLKVHDNEDAKQAEIRDLLKARDYLDYKIAMLRDSNLVPKTDDICDENQSNKP